MRNSSEPALWIRRPMWGGGRCIARFQGVLPGFEGDTEQSEFVKRIHRRAGRGESPSALFGWDRLGTLFVDVEVNRMRARGTILVIAMVLTIPFAVAADSPEDGAGGGGGPMPSILFLDLGGLNEAVTSADYPRISEVLFTMGASGYGGRAGGVRFGGTGSSGATTSRNDERSVRLELETYGFLIEKAAVSDSGLTIILGTVLGGGSLDLRLIDRFPDSFDDAVGAPYVASMTKDFYSLQPYVAFEARPLSWMATRFQLSFLWALTDPWTFEEVEFAGPPRTLTGLVASLTVQFGGHVGDDEDVAPKENAEDQPLPESESEESPEEPPSE